MARDLLADAGAGVALVVHGERLDVGLDGGDEVDHLRPQDRAVHQVERLVIAVVAVPAAFRLDGAVIMRLRRIVLFLVQLGQRQEELPRGAFRVPAIQDGIQGFLRRRGYLRGVVRDRDRQRQDGIEAVQERVLVPVLQRVVRVVPAGGEDELVQGLEVDVHVAVLEHLVVEVVLGEFGVQREQGTVFLGGVRELVGAGGVLRAVLRDLPPAGLVVLPRGAVHAQLELRVGPVHIGLGEVWIQFDGLVVIGQRVFPPAHLQEEAGPVEVREDVVRVDVDDAVHVREGRREIAHLGRY